MHLVLSRAGPDDFDQIVPAAYKSFSKDNLSPVFFGFPRPGTYPRMKKLFMDDAEKNATDIWIKVEDWDAEEVDVEGIVAEGVKEKKGEGKSEGEEAKGGETVKRKQKRIVAACDWRINTTYIPPKNEDGDKEKPLEDEYHYLDTDKQRIDAKTVMTDYFTQRNAAAAELGAHVFCYICFVDPEYQRKGVGTMMMQWGNEVADALMLPCRLEASAFGEGLYRKMGYVNGERASWTTESFGRCSVLLMHRPTKTERMETDAERGLTRFS